MKTTCSKITISNLKAPLVRTGMKIFRRMRTPPFGGEWEEATDVSPWSLTKIGKVEGRTIAL